MDIVLTQPAVIAVITWGLSDRYTWLKKLRPRDYGENIRPLPLNNNLNPKLAWFALADALKRFKSVFLLFSSYQKTI